SSAVAFPAGVAALSLVRLPLTRERTYKKIAQSFKMKVPLPKFKRKKAIFLRNQTATYQQ
ncbi:hypothetical protein P4626_14970, partial [Halalkalibacterium halodurans]|uniref:hypothetical protein n=1 Tax=Halalkalibacterium halodurans TaxID=86665 RepID=UPI002E1E915C|nr:hypothetical protein [Halalkalibacterium halodurans]